MNDYNIWDSAALYDGGWSSTDIWDSAAALYDGGWSSTDKADLMAAYDLDEETAIAICEKLKEFEK